jgi:hypothetical protein
VVLVLSSALLFGAASSAKKTSSKSTHPSSQKSTSTKASTSHKTGSSKASKSTAQKGSKPPTHSAGKSASHKSSKSAASKGGKHGKKAVASQPRQQAPSADRYKEIQQALVDRGYFNGPVDGNWNKDSVDALKRFQKDQNLTSDGKISSLGLIGLGLGPKHEPVGAIAAKPASDATPNP